MSLVVKLLSFEGSRGRTEHCVGRLMETVSNIAWRSIVTIEMCRSLRKMLYQTVFLIEFEEEAVVRDNWLFRCEKYAVLDSLFVKYPSSTF